MKISKFMFLIEVTALIIVVGCAQSIHGVVLNPKEPSITKPSDMLFCETDNDCTTTIHKEGTCCSFCEYAVNNYASNYLKEWDELNCNNSRSMDECITFECMRVLDVRCEYNKCVVNYEKS